jgi:hypothetical protein
LFLVQSYWFPNQEPSTNNAFPSFPLGLVQSPFFILAGPVVASQPLRQSSAPVPTVLVDGTSYRKPWRPFRATYGSLLSAGLPRPGIQAFTKARTSWPSPRMIKPRTHAPFALLPSSLVQLSGLAGPAVASHPLRQVSSPFSPSAFSLQPSAFFPPRSPIPSRLAGFPLLALDVAGPAVASQPLRRPLDARLGLVQPSSLTPLASRQAVAPSGLRLHRCLPRIFPDAWFSLQPSACQSRYRYR